MFTDDLLALANAHKWVPLAAILIGLLLRVAKRDPKVMRHKRWLPWVSVGLGVVAGILAKVWLKEHASVCVVGGLFAGTLPVSGHEMLVEAFRQGKELPVFVGDDNRKLDKNTLNGAHKDN